MRQVPGPRTQGPSGLAQVTFSKTGAAVLFKDGNFVGQSFNIPLEGYPDQFAVPPSGEYNVRLSGDGKKLYGVSPYNATVTARLVKFAAAEGQIPQPKHFVGLRTKRDNTTYPVDEMTFTAILVCTNNLFPKYAGLRFAIPLPYATKGFCYFADDGTGQTVIQGTTDKANFLASFVKYLGGEKLTVPYSSNILPDLERALLEANIEVLVVLERGWPTSISEAPSRVEAKPKKSPSKKPRN